MLLWRFICLFVCRCVANRITPQVLYGFVRNFRGRILGWSTIFWAPHITDRIRMGLILDRLSMLITPSVEREGLIYSQPIVSLVSTWSPVISGVWGMSVSLSFSSFPLCRLRSRPGRIRFMLRSQQLRAVHTEPPSRWRALSWSYALTQVCAYATSKLTSYRGHWSVMCRRHGCDSAVVAVCCHL